MWDSHKASIRAGQFSGQDFYTKVGLFSAGFGHDNQAISDYSFAVGKSNIIAINAISSTITGGESNEVHKPYSGFFLVKIIKLRMKGPGFLLFLDMPMIFDQIMGLLDQVKTTR